VRARDRGVEVRVLVDDGITRRGNPGGRRGHSWPPIGNSP
jgi:hypothetical protein